MIRRILVSVVCVLVASSCAAQTKRQSRPCDCNERDTHERLNGTLWMQTSAEYEALAATTYRQATESVLAMKKDIDAGKKVHSAALEQPGCNDRKLKPAVIVDIDETILDNSPMSGQLIEERVGWDQAMWDDWVRLQRADFIAGADGFVTAVRKAGVEVFFVTNRKESEERDTLQDLRPMVVTDRQLLASAEKDEVSGEVWTSEKKTRRAAVAREYWILALVGDDLADFIPGVRSDVSPDERRGAMKQHADRFGEQWFLLPNPLYGSWESAVVKTTGDANQLAEKRSKVRRFPADDKR
jgi:5'-nucleotidase (lipoprotein e(P4) family)